MTDVALVWGELEADLALDGHDLLTDDGLETVVTLCLGTDKRVGPDVEVPGSPEDRGGWWGDRYLGQGAAFSLGSHLWLVQAAKNINEAVTLAERYAHEALAWMVDDGIASVVDVVASAEQVAPHSFWIVLDIAIARPNEPVHEQRFKQFWEAV